MDRLHGQIKLNRLYGDVNLVPSSVSSANLTPLTIYPSHDEQVFSVGEGDEFDGYSVVTAKPVPREPVVQVGIAVNTLFKGQIDITAGCGVSVGVRTVHAETVETEIEYSTHLGGWFISSSGVSTTTSAIVIYSFPVKNGATYTVTMTEIGSRLRRGLTTVDPSTITGNEGSIISDYVDDTSSNAVGYQFEYTATKDGWYLVYVSNQDERPVVSVVVAEQIWVDD